MFDRYVLSICARAFYIDLVMYCWEVFRFEQFFGDHGDWLARSLARKWGLAVRDIRSMMEFALRDGYKDFFAWGFGFLLLDALCSVFCWVEGSAGWE